MPGTGGVCPRGIYDVGTLDVGPQVSGRRGGGGRGDAWHRGRSNQLHQIETGQSQALKMSGCLPEHFGQSGQHRQRQGGESKRSALWERQNLG